MSTARVAIIQLEPRSITLERARDGRGLAGSYKLSITNAIDKSFSARVEIKPDGNTAAEWLVFDKERLLFELDQGRTESMPINVQVPLATPEGSFGFTVRVVDTALPDERFDKLGASFAVPKLVIEKPPSRLPAWLLLLIIGGVVALGGIGFLLYKVFSKPGLGDSCSPDEPVCPQQVACDPIAKRCLAAIGQGCEKDAHCLTHHCGATGQCGPLLAGDDCDPQKPLCAPQLLCAQPARRCLAANGASCTKNEDCASNRCFNGRCTFIIIEPQPGGWQHNFPSKVQPGTQLRLPGNQLRVPVEKTPLLRPQGAQ